MLYFALQAISAETVGRQSKTKLKTDNTSFFCVNAKDTFNNVIKEDIIWNPIYRQPVGQD